MQAASDECPGLTPAQLHELARVDTLWAQAHRESALVALDSLLLQTDRESQPLFRARLLRRRGARRLFFGNAIGAEPDLHEAADLAVAQDDTLALCVAVRWLSLALEQQGRVAEARAAYERLQVLAIASGDCLHEGWSLIGLAYYASRDGCNEEALRDYRRAAELFREAGDAGGEIWAQNGLGLVLSNQGAYRRALTCFRRAVELARDLNSQCIEATALNNVGCLEFSLGDPSVALEAFEQALELHRRRGSAHASITPSINIALCHSKLGRYESAEAILQGTLQECRDQSYADLHASVMTHLARLSKARGRPYESARRYRQVLAENDQLSLRMQLKCHMGISADLARVDSLEGALAQAKAGIDLLGERIQHDLWAELKLLLGERFLALGHNRGALDHLLSGARAAGDLGQSQLQVGGLGMAGRICREQGEQDRALKLLSEAAGIWEAARDLPLDPEWREQRGTSGRVLYTELAAVLLEIPGRPERERAREAFDRLQVFKARTLQERMLGPGEALTALAGQREANLATLAALQERVLQPGELFLDAYLGVHTSILFAITRQECRVVNLPPDEHLEGRLRRFHELLSSPAGGVAGDDEAAVMQGVAQEIARTLFGELADLIQVSRRVIVSADGALNLVPFAQLPCEPLPAESGASVSRSREWMRVPSATALLWLRDPVGRFSETAAARHAPASGAVRILAIAGREGESGQPLRGAIEEIRGLGKRYRNVAVYVLPTNGVILGPEMMRDPDILHLASHTRLDDQSPWQSEIRFVPGGSGFALRAAQIAGLELRARLAVLSSCESAGGRILSGEGVLGLSSAFLSAGVPVVLATLWPVDDGATALFMERFYEELAGGASVAAALSDTRRMIRSRPEMAHPFFWAGFVLSGDGGICIPLERKPRLLWLVVPGVALLAAGIGLVRRRRALAL
jgi:tetratricopeptide (TPR) repeat protein